MGYHTDFNGSLQIAPPLSEERTNYINRFSGTRRMKRDVNKLNELYSGEFGLDGNYGKEGEFFAKDDGDHGQGRDASIIDFNQEPSTQPGLWCKWAISPDGTTLEWDGGEKFYDYVEWLKYVIANFIAPTGSVCNGEIVWQGEDSGDMGKIVVKDNKVTTKKVKIEYVDDDDDE